MSTSAPSFSAACERRMASAVDVAPVLAMTGTRLLACLMTVSMRSSRSSEDRAPTSPVEPAATTPSTPPSIERSTMSFKVSTSMVSSWLKGVDSAVRTPRRLLDMEGFP
jgi:hypothetical protein